MEADDMTLRDDPRVLICRLSAIGDCILTLPLLCALRDQFPRAYLAWIVERGAAPLLEHHPCLDRLIVVNKGWMKSPWAVRQIRRELRALQFDIAIDPQSLTKSAVVARLSGAWQRIGFERPRGRELSRWLNNALVAPTKTHLVDAQLQLLEALGNDRPRVRFMVPRDEAAETRMDGLLRAMHLGCPFAVMNVGAGWDSRIWPAARYGRMAKFLGESRHLPSLMVWAGERERSWAEEAVAGSGGHALLAPPTSLPELCALLRRSRMYLGSDTGPMHLAAAVGTPCVGLFGTTQPSESGPYGAQHVCVQHHFQRGSSRQRRKAPNLAMCAITTDMACEACHVLLDRNRSERAA
jgi:lipopolysaccharide heptosyltransferase I